MAESSKIQVWGLSFLQFWTPSFLFSDNAMSNQIFRVPHARRQRSKASRKDVEQSFNSTISCQALT